LTEASKLFGFVQLDLAGALPLADGRYVVRDDGEETVLVIETLGAPAPPRRRRRRPREANPDQAPSTLPMARVTVVLASHPYGDEAAADSWLESVADDEAVLDELATNATETLNRALHVHAVVSENSHAQELSPSRATTTRIGFGSGKQVASGEWATALDIDPIRSRGSSRHRRTEELRPQERTAAILGGREQLDACETLLLRARADLDAGRTREAALQLRVGLDALLVELQDRVDDPAHDQDMASLEQRRQEMPDYASAAIQGTLDATQLTAVVDALQLCERVLRRRRVLGG